MWNSVPSSMPASARSRPGSRTRRSERRCPGRRGRARSHGPPASRAGTDGSRTNRAAPRRATCPLGSARARRATEDRVPSKISSVAAIVNCTVDALGHGPEERRRARWRGPSWSPCAGRSRSTIRVVEDRQRVARSAAAAERRRTARRTRSPAGRSISRTPSGDDRGDDGPRAHASPAGLDPEREVDGRRRRAGWRSRPRSPRRRRTGGSPSVAGGIGDRVARAPRRRPGSGTSGPSASRRAREQLGRVVRPDDRQGNAQRRLAASSCVEPRRRPAGLRARGSAARSRPSPAVMSTDVRREQCEGDRVLCKPRTEVISPAALAPASSMPG